MSLATPSPFFVFGALRSGTTLLRLILDGHPKIQSLGEADYLFDHIEQEVDGSDEWHYDLDALKDDWILSLENIVVPEGVQGRDLTFALIRALDKGKPDAMLSINIHRNISKMVAMFPQAKIIHLLRDPRDVARSAVGMGWFGNSYYGTQHWLETETGWNEVELQDEQVLTIHFEELMQDLGAGLSRICDFLGLSFEPVMLEYHTKTTYEPPNPKIAQQWRRNAGKREVARIDGQIGSLMQERGYEFAGDPVYPGAAEKLYLSVDNRLRRWRFNIRRYGLRLFVAHHLAHRFGSKRWGERLKDAQRKIDTDNLK